MTERDQLVTLDPVVLAGLSVRELLAHAQRLRDARAAVTTPAAGEILRLAILGGFTTGFIARVLELFLAAEGLSVAIYESPYGALEENVLNPESELYRFSPEVVALLVHHGNLQGRPGLLESEPEIARRAETEAARWVGHWQTLRERLAATVVQSTFDVPRVRPLGNLDGLVPYGDGPYVARVNRLLAAAATRGVSLFDAAGLKATCGLDAVEDPATYHLNKQPFGFDFLGRYCFHLARLLAAHRGRVRKCLVLDLDDTLWGGVVGDDGWANLVLGSTSPEGEAHAAFQRYCLALKQRGVLLAVCSKNEERIAREAFERHPEMVLGLDDIACFAASWDDKAEVLPRIAQQLNLGLDALVFVDDNPRERHRVREALPEVAVVELGEDPADFAAAVQAGAYFEVPELTAEATQRAASYIQEDRRRAARTSAVDYESYLAGLELRAAVEPLDEANITRAAELIKRTNQWNLRTVRYSIAELEERLSTAGWTGFCVRLTDRFGEYGVIAVVLLQCASGECFIDSWLMSCRVFKRTVEYLVFDEIIARARRSGAAVLRGEYRPTAKNTPVATLFTELGFQREGDGESGSASQWVLDLTESPRCPPHHIRRSDSDD